jgi:hypothetical protein
MMKMPENFTLFYSLLEKLILVKKKSGIRPDVEHKNGRVILSDMSGAF